MQVPEMSDDAGFAATPHNPAARGNKAPRRPFVILVIFALIALGLIVLPRPGLSRQP